MVVDGALVITDVNEAMVAKAGCARSELIGNPLERFLSLPPQDAEQVQQTIAAGAALKFEGMLLPRSGERRTIALNVTTFRDPDGLPRGLFTAGP